MRQIQRTDSTDQHCLIAENCCAEIVAANQNCYRAQCFASTRGLAKQLQLQASRYETTFQSRFGKAEWIGPSTDERIEDLARAGCRRLLVICPAFVADCLETLEEIAIGERERFVAAGGEEIRVVPCVNSSDSWADAVVDMASR